MQSTRKCGRMMRLVSDRLVLIKGFTQNVKTVINKSNKVINKTGENRMILQHNSINKLVKVYMKANYSPRLQEGLEQVLGLPAWRISLTGAGQIGPLPTRPSANWPPKKVCHGQIGPLKRLPWANRPQWITSVIRIHL